MKSSNCEFLDSRGNWINGSLEKAVTHFLTCYFHKSRSERLATVRRHWENYRAERVEKRLLYHQFREKLADIRRDYKPVYGGNNVVGSCACHYLDALKTWQSNDDQSQADSLALAKQKLDELKRMENEWKEKEAALKRIEEEQQSAFKRKWKVLEELRRNIEATSLAIHKLKADANNYEGFWNKRLNSDAQEELNTLSVRLRALTANEKHSAPSRYKPDDLLAREMSAARHQARRCAREATTLRGKIRELTASMTQEKKEAAKKRAREKRAAYKAILAHARGNSRKLAQKIKSKLELTVDCPYCGETLGEQPHADHIYPQSKGGLSRLENLVYVCGACNARKSDLTLLAFIEECSLDRKRTESRLKELGKEF